MLDFGVPLGETFVLIFHGVHCRTCWCGYHSKSKEKKYNKLCSEACLLAAELLSVEHKSAVDAVEAAVAYLEDCPLTNAGIGSNLTINGFVECDAASQLSWEKYKSWLRSEGKMDAVMSNSHITSHYDYSSESKKSRVDTVGAVCIDLKGNIASAASSGGIAMKYEGRVGQACTYGCGCWAEELSQFSRIGVVTSGTGEQLVRTQLAQRSADDSMVPQFVFQMQFSHLSLKDF
ncbi:unnamed protein product [Heterobilharzia americana]|nr:unnamed protein product [Heterobilharzia americana]